MKWRERKNELLLVEENRELASSSDAIINNVAARRAWRGSGEGGTQESRPHAAPGRRSRPTCRSSGALARTPDCARAPPIRHELDLPMRERNTLNS
ncbi:hypothetical protein B5X24_HaOG205091 [Helicoverpa armigera]|nr:hypothetical protein B5X24_HaOG205091 [Helicoverpa armigera]